MSIDISRIRDGRLVIASAALEQLKIINDTLYRTVADTDLQTSGAFNLFDKEAATDGATTYVDGGVGSNELHTLSAFIAIDP